jgi:hypothetical protein
MDDGKVVDTFLATDSWDEDTWFDGSNNVSKATGSNLDHEKLHVSSKGRYYVVSTSQWANKPDAARWLTPSEAAAWLFRNGHDLPDDLKDLGGSIIE